HESLDGGVGVLRVGDGLSFGRAADEALTVFLVGDDRGRRAGSFGIRDHHRFPAFHPGDDRVGGAEVTANDSAHERYRSLVRNPWRTMLVPCTQERCRLACSATMSGSSRR